MLLLLPPPLEDIVMSDFNFKELSWSKKINLICVNLTAIYLLVPMAMLPTVIAFIAHPLLSIVSLLLLAVFAWRYMVWMNQNPEELPLYIAPLTAFLLLCFVSGCFVFSGYFFEGVYLKSRIGLCATGFLWVGYVMWHKVMRYCSIPLMEKLWNHLSKPK